MATRHGLRPSESVHAVDYDYICMTRSSMIDSHAAGQQGQPPMQPTDNRDARQLSRLVCAR
jgi:hypothetical protein